MVNWLVNTEPKLFCFWLHWFILCSLALKWKNQRILDSCRAIRICQPWLQKVASGLTLSIHAPCWWHYSRLAMLQYVLSMSCDSSSHSLWFTIYWGLLGLIGRDTNAYPITDHDSGLFAWVTWIHANFTTAVFQRQFDSLIVTTGFDFESVQYFLLHI